MLNAYGEGLKDTFIKEFEKRGGKVLIAEGIKQGTNNVRDQITKIIQIHKSSQLDGIYLAIYPTEHPIVLKQTKELGLSIPILATETFDDPSIYKTNEAEGVIFSLPAPPDPFSRARQHFMEAFRKKYGEDPGITADAAYDALKMLVMCIRQVGYDGSKIQQCLLNIRNYDGAAGSTSFDQNGDVIKPFIFKQVKSGQAVNYSDNLYYPN